MKPTLLAILLFASLVYLYSATVKREKVPHQQKTFNLSAVGFSSTRPFDQYIEFRASQGTRATFYPQSGNLPLKGSEICVANDDNSDSVYVRTDGVAADATETNCATSGCKNMEFKPRERGCRQLEVKRVSVDAAGDGANIRLWIHQQN